MKDVAWAWDAADQGQRNKLARCLFEEVWLKDKQVVAVKPRSEFEPFFRLNYGEFVKENIELATRGGFEPPISGLTGRYVRPLHHRAASLARRWPYEGHRVDCSYQPATCQGSVLMVYD